MSRLYNVPCQSELCLLGYDLLASSCFVVVCVGSPSLVLPESC